MNCECEKKIKYSCPPLTDEFISVRGSKTKIEGNIFGTLILIVSLRGFSIKNDDIFKLNFEI